MRALIKPFQFTIAWSTGASARADKMEEAKITPPLALSSSTSNAPTVRMSDWSASRSILDSPPNAAPDRASLFCAAA